MRAQADLSKESLLSGRSKMDTFRLSQQKFRNNPGGVSAASSALSQSKDIEEILMKHKIPSKPTKRLNPLGVSLGKES